MASFESANLDHELKDKFVLFKLSMKMRFQPEEVGNRWLLQIEFREHDPMKDDQLFIVPEAVRFGEVDAGKIRKYIIPSKEEAEISEEIEFPAHLVDTEMGKEEVYAIVELKPVGEGSTFVPAQTRTNITEVDV
jgi:hypothetical protein